MKILIMRTPIFEPTESHLDQVRAVDDGAEIDVVEGRDTSDERFAPAEVIFGWPAPQRLRAARNLRWLHLPSAGADRFAQRSLYFRDDVLLSSSKGVFSQPIAEHVLAMMLAFSRNLHSYAAQQTKREWNRLPPVCDFSGSTVGILGLGHIGRAIAERATALGAEVVAVRRTGGPPPPCVNTLYDENGVDEVVVAADFLALSLPRTPATEGILSADRIARMKPGAFVFNIGRGSAIDQTALEEALAQGHLGGAGLDVTDPEPLPQTSRLWSLPNVIITPHSSGASPTNDDRRFRIFCTNLSHYLQRQPLGTQVDFEAGY